MMCDVCLNDVTPIGEDTWFCETCNVKLIDSDGELLREEKPVWPAPALVMIEIPAPSENMYELIERLAHYDEDTDLIDRLMKSIDEYEENRLYST